MLFDEFKAVRKFPLDRFAAVGQPKRLLNCLLIIGTCIVGDALSEVPGLFVDEAFVERFVGSRWLLGLGLHPAMTMTFTLSGLRVD